MSIATMVAIAGVDRRSFALFFGAYMVVFLLSGMGNGSTYRMIPSIFAALGPAAASLDEADRASSSSARPRP